MTTVQSVLQRAVGAGVVPGALVLVDRDGDVRIEKAGGRSPGGAAYTDDTIFRIQSMTKPIVTAATLRLVEAGRLSLSDPVHRWLPELAERRVLRTPGAAIGDTVPAERPIVVRDLLVNGSGYGIDVTGATPLGRAMSEAGVDAGADPVTIGAQQWLDRLAALPLAHQPGEGFRYHHGFALLGILLSRLVGRRLHDHLVDDVYGPLGMTDTGHWVPQKESTRLPPAYRLVDGRLVETEPAAGGGIWVGEPTLDVAHNELVSTAGDLHRFSRMLLEGGRLPDGDVWLSPESVREMTRDQVPSRVKTPESFYPGFWGGTGWGYGLCVRVAEPHVGRYGWSGGQGTDFFVDPVTRRIVIVLTQVDLCPEVFAVIDAAGEAV